VPEDRSIMILCLSGLSDVSFENVLIFRQNSHAYKFSSSVMGAW